MSASFPLTDAKTVVYDDVWYDFKGRYFHSGLRNAPIRVWSDSDGTEIHYRPDTSEVLVIGPDASTFVEPDEVDGDTVYLEAVR
jgi:hypothetical protein